MTLVHRGSRLLEFIGQKASHKTLHWLTSKNVEVLLDQSVDLDSVSEDGRVYTTSHGDKITADAHFICVGTPLSSSWLQDSILKDCINNRGQLTVDENLRIRGRSNIFAIGDITDIPVSIGFFYSTLNMLFYFPKLHKLHITWKPFFLLVWGYCVLILSSLPKSILQYIERFSLATKYKLNISSHVQFSYPLSSIHFWHILVGFRERYFLRVTHQLIHLT